MVLFHVLIEGECIIECGAPPPVSMKAGHVIVFPHSDPHTVEELKHEVGASCHVAKGQRLGFT